MNTQSFTPEQVKKGLMVGFLQQLIKLQTEICNNNKSMEILITTDGYCTIIEWDDCQDGEHFKFIDSEHEIVKELRFPDNHCEYVFDEENEKDVWDEWIKNNPGWVKTPYGNWTNEIENEKLRKELGENE